MNNLEKSEIDGDMNHKSDFEAQFRDRIREPNPEIIQKDLANSNVKQQIKKDKIVFIILIILAVVGAIIVIVATVLCIGSLMEERENEELDEELLVEWQDDAAAYRDLTFRAEGISNAPLLVYMAARNGEVVSTEWLDEFREASERYAEKYTDRRAIPSDVFFGEATVLSGLRGELYPNESIKRFLLDTSGGCARFDLYDDMLVIYDYEFLGSSCSESEWNFLGGEEED